MRNEPARVDIGQPRLDGLANVDLIDQIVPRGMVRELLNETPRFFLNVGHTTQYGDELETGKERAGPPNVNWTYLSKITFQRLFVA